MTVAFEAGYTLPVGDLPLNYARVLHDGVRFHPKTISATDAATNYPASAANIGDTVDRWRPFANEATDPSDFSMSTWTATNVTVGADGLTLTETTATGEHDISQAYTFTAVETVVAFKVERQTIPEIQVRANDGTTSFTCFFDLRDGTVGTAANCTGKIVETARNEYLALIYFTPLAAAGVIELLASNGSEVVSYTGVITNTIKVQSAYVHASAASLTYDLFAADEGNMMCIAAHNIWSSGATIVPQYLGDDVTNLLTYSEQFDNAAWIKQANVTITANAGLAPDGRLTADQHAISAASARLVSQTVAVSALTTYTFSIYVKRVSGSGNATLELFGDSSGSTTSVVAISDEWARYTVTKTTGVADTTLRCGFFPNASGDEVLIWGAQLQEGAESTSYIQTEAISVTSGWRNFSSWITATDNSPLMFIFSPVTSASWRIEVLAGVVPEIGVFRVGVGLQMERPFYGGHAPTPMNRMTEVNGNISGSGELLGRSRRRTILKSGYSWNHLTYDWVRANLDGKNGLIQSVETEALFVAWRPSETQDVDYVMRASAQAPQASGQRDLFSFSMSGEVYSYE